MPSVVPGAAPTAEHKHLPQKAADPLPSSSSEELAVVRHVAGVVALPFGPASEQAAAVAVAVVKAA